MADLPQEKVVTSHHLEDVFDIEKGTTEVAISKHTSDSSAFSSSALYDNVDRAINDGVDEVYDAALAQALDLQQSMAVADIDTKASLAQASAILLRVALEAQKTKAQVKTSKDSNIIKQQQAEAKSNQPTVVLDHATLLKMINDQKKLQELEDKTIEGEK